MKKLLLISGIILIVLVLGAFVLYQSGDWLGYLLWMNMVETEVKRIPSPDDKVEAVLITRDIGAASPTKYLIFVLPKGSKIPKGRDRSPVFAASYAQDLIFNWTSVKQLEIAYRDAHILGFHNHSYPLPDSDEYVVRIREIQK